MPPQRPLCVVGGKKTNVSPAMRKDPFVICRVNETSSPIVFTVRESDEPDRSIPRLASADESPSFVSNSRFVIFSSKQRGRGVLVLASVDGKVRSTLSLPSADIRDHQGWL